MLGSPLAAEPDEKVTDDTSPVVKKAVMCEAIVDRLPVNPTVIFSVSKSSAYCWTKFDPVYVDGVIYHEWYSRGTLIKRNELEVRKPWWDTYSELKIRQADIGPWHLNITDENGNVLKTLRFSVTE